MEDLDIAGLVQETLLLISHELKEHDIRIETDLQPMPTIRADRDQIKQVFLNITLNAMQAMPGGGTLDISTAVTDDHVSVSFRDEGPGISETVHQRLFEPFFTTKEEGIGLGLPIVKRIIQDHHGTIRVESMEGKGSTFTITLPLAYSERG
jgi:signal transduction histidine kinase